MEFYDFAIYSYMSESITANFFGAGHGGSLGTWAGFAVTCFFRPLGGIFFGWVGDRIGRKPAMRITIVLMLLTTLVQGLLPTFYCCSESAGWAGLVGLFLIRAIQGMSAGGELPTAIVYITEVAPRERLGLSLSWISVTGCFGAWVVAAFVVFCLQTVLTTEQMHLWGWRLPYLCSVVPGLLIILARKHLTETPAFEKSKLEEMEMQVASSAETGTEGIEHEATAFREIMTNHKLGATIGACGAAIYGVLSFVPAMYGAQLLRQRADLPSNWTTFSEVISYLIPAVCSPFVGLLIDRWGVGRVYALSALLAGAVTLPVMFWWTHVSHEDGLVALLIGQSLLGLCLAFTTAICLWSAELFPVRVRVTGCSLAYNIGCGIFGGLGPLISDAGNTWISPEGLISAPALYTLVAAIVSFSACIISRILAKRGVLTIAHIRAVPY